MLGTRRLALSQNPQPQPPPLFHDSLLQFPGEICPIMNLTYLVRVRTANMTLDDWHDME